MSDELPPQVRDYIDAHPDASASVVLGQFAGALSPEDMDAVADALEGESPELNLQNGGEDPEVLVKDEGDGGLWADAGFTTPESGVWPPELLDREQWMGHVEKKPFAPWADRDHPDAEPDEDARWKWGITDNYVDGETIAMGEADDRLDGRAFLQQPDDPFAYVDGDDVRDPDTGEVHPAFVDVLEALGITYADVSQSGGGVHAQYQGELPEGVKQAAWQLDDKPFGANDDLPSVEIYAGKRVCVATGEHVPGTPVEVREWDEDGLRELLKENDELPEPRERPAAAREELELDDHEPTATGSDETTDDIRDVFTALDRIDARDVAARTIVHRWNDDASTSEGKRAFIPTWGKSANGTANVVDSRIWQDTGDEAGYGGPVVMALIDAGEMTPRNASPRKASGEKWWRGIERLRDLGFAIPEYDAPDDSSEPVVALPLAKLNALDPDDAKRYARERGLEWPNTREARQRLEDRLLQAVRGNEKTVLDAPTSMGKSYTTASIPWLNHAHITGEQPVIHLHATRDARDEAAEHSEDGGASYARLRGRTEACPVAAGDHDPKHSDDDGGDGPTVDCADCIGEQKAVRRDDDPETVVRCGGCGKKHSVSAGVPVEATDEDEPDQVVTVDGVPASQWLNAMCDGRGLPFSVAHAYLREHNDQGLEHLPCAPEGQDCPAAAQWDGVPYDDEGRPSHDVVHATHEFAHVPKLRRGTNIIMDERPDYQADLTQEQVRRAVTAFLKEVDAPVRDYEELMSVARQGLNHNEHAEPISRDELNEAIDEMPDREWFIEADGAHALAPALTRAIAWGSERANGRLVGKTRYEPPRFDVDAEDDDNYGAAEYVTVVFDENNDLQYVRDVPSFDATRAVVGLDAHPVTPVWAANTHPDMVADKVLSTEERRLWRFFERGLEVVQVGDATRPLSSGEYFAENSARTLVEHLRDHYGEQFRTAITASAVEEELEEILVDAGVNDPDTMHYGEEKSRNDFAGEDVGYLEGCIDPGDDYVLNLLGELELEAEPETREGDDGEEYRAHGRGFVGEDADTAQEILASVREEHVAQAAGRYARNPDDPDDRAVVFVRTDAMPPGFADLQVPGVEWVATDRQADVIRALRDGEHATAAELADAAGCSREHARQTLAKLLEQHDGLLRVDEYAGENGAHVYQALFDDKPLDSGMVNLTGESPTTPYGDTCTWSLEISRPTSAATAVRRGSEARAPSGQRNRGDLQAGLTSFEAD